MKDDAETQAMVWNEIATMRYLDSISDKQALIKIEEVIMYRGKQLIFLELMDDSIDKFAKWGFDKYGEDVIKYIIYRSLFGIQLMHS